MNAVNLSPARLSGESFAAYKIRRAAGNRRPAPRFRHVSTEIVLLPVIGADAAVDRAVIAGNYRDLVVVALPDGRQMRRGRTKGVSFRYPVPRAQARAVALAASRAARQ